jgi:hypothetical protein
MMVLNCKDELASPQAMNNFIGLSAKADLIINLIEIK